MYRKVLIFSVILVGIHTSAWATRDWRNYAVDCGGRMTCMKAQAAAYAAFIDGNFEEQFKEICKRRHVKPRSRNYTGALRCVRAMQRDYDDRQYRRAAIENERASAEYNREAAKYYKEKTRYLQCINKYGHSPRCRRYRH